MIRSRSVAVRWTAAALAVGLLAAGCGGHTEQPSSGPPVDSSDFVTDGTFATVIAQDAGNLHPLTTNYVATQIVDSYLYDSLLFFDPQTGKPKPYLAEKWSETPTSASFTLRKGITCSDGSAFTAETVADNINWIVDPKNQSPLRDSIIPSDARATADAAANTITVTVPQPKSFLLFDVGAQQLGCQDVVDHPTKYKTAALGTGLFQLTEVVPNDHYTLTRRDGYEWGPDGKTTSNTPGVPKTVTIKVIKNPSTVANLVLSGQLNMATVEGPDLARMKGLTSKSSPSMSGELSFNQMKGKPTADPTVRTALFQAVDWDAWTKVHTADQGSRAKTLSVLTPSPCQYDSIAGNLPGHDPAAAAAALDEAGWKKGSDGVRTKDGKQLALTVVFRNNSDSSSASAELLQTAWQKLGAKITLKGGDANFVLNETISSKDPGSWDVTPGLTLQSNLPNIFVPYVTGDGPPKGTNYSSIDNPEYAAAATKADRLAGDQSCAAWAEADASLIKDLNLVPISVTPTKIFFNGASSIYEPLTSMIPGPAVRVVAK
ncbi:ABC transporter substrate-binding protein [Microlunatus soli]|uniref:Peptide/nickel transport system substrate-binding protein n=1 Tax=Microlunatus soli TaxID=630515 RepID=A0A1H1UBZ4_9ACTN|nr:ABC transporter substrate-binding protein [Microlunatus soli]SDS70025.1 peptide/nickel transport system substrate-binding protein [Microlunatus soli]